MSAEELLRQLRATIESARTLPLSSSAVVHRGQVLTLVEQLEAALQDEELTSAGAEHVDSVVSRAGTEEDVHRDAAKAKRERELGDSDIVSSARKRAEQMLAAAERESREFRAETDEYVDSQLAMLEISLTKTLHAVARGRAQLHGGSDLDELASTEEGLSGSETDLGGLGSSR